ncbi:biotin/lipoyl-containing protein, partial [Stutzerimonas stutzeri]|uniref:biotin/lipoyl-containing protein n=1 Tax=Stutzerimonas stutzeri TaxID=316 RepID=UPI0003627C7C
VAWQIRGAGGEPLPITQEQVPLTGHAIEVRLYAEDPDNDFLPATGTLDLYRESAAGPGRRVDSGVAEGDTVSPFYDPMLGKLIAWGENREEARLRLLAMLDETCVGGVRTNLAFLRRVIGHPAFAAAELDTGFIPRHETELMRAPGELPEAFWQLAGKLFVQTEPAIIRGDDLHSPWAKREGMRFGMPARVGVHLQCNGESRLVRIDAAAATEAKASRQPKAIRKDATLYLEWNGELQAVTAFDPIAEVEASHQHHGGLTAPMNGSIVRVLVEAGQNVEAGATLVVLEAMKMEHSIRAQQAGVVKALFCAEGDMVNEGTVLLEMEEA